jgi:hypothetical protein
MSNQRASMQARLASLNAVQNKTPAQAQAAANISSALSRMDAYDAKVAGSSKPGRSITFHDREFLMKLAGDSTRHQSARDRANRILNGGSDMTEGDADFINRSGG